MTSREKIEWVRKAILEEAEINPSGLFRFDLYNVRDIDANGGIPDEAPLLISKKEQWSIIQKLEEEGFVKNVSLDDNEKNLAWLEMGIDTKNGDDKKRKGEEKSVYADTIRTIDDLLINLELRNRCLYIISTFGQVKRGQSYKTGIQEQDSSGSFQPYEIILLLGELGLVEKIDLKGFYEQTEYKAVGSRRIEFTFQADKILDFVDRANGKNGIIRKQALEFIARRIGDLASGNDLVDFLRDLGVHEPLIVYPNTKWKMVYDVLLYYAASPNSEEQKFLFKIIEEASHPLMHGGDKNAAEETIKKFNSFLEYDKFWLQEGTLWKEWGDPSEAPGWFDKDGNNWEDGATALYVVLQEKNDELYVYWNEVIKLVKFYFNDRASQDDEINGLYFELINRVERLINGIGCGGVQKVYKRPFGNIIGCEFEAQKQGLSQDALFVKLYEFLGIVTNTCLPNKENVEKIKKGNANFLEKIKKYYDEHSSKKPEEKPPVKSKPLQTSTKKIIHQHTHKFENSIQEKDLNLTHKVVQEPAKPKTKAEYNKTVIYWNEIGDLYRDPKIKYCYAMGQEKDRHKIIKYLINNKGFRPTFQIASIFEGKSEDTIIKEIGKINSTARGKLGIKDNIVLGRKGSGYRINPAYHFALKNQ